MGTFTSLRTEIRTHIHTDIQTDLEKYKIKTNAYRKTDIETCRLTLADTPVQLVGHRYINKCRHINRLTNRQTVTETYKIDR